MAGVLALRVALLPCHLLTWLGSCAWAMPSDIILPIRLSRSCILQAFTQLTSLHINQIEPTKPARWHT
jgi:hypothetical protein